MEKISLLKPGIGLLLFLLLLSSSSFAQKNLEVVFDTYHGQNPQVGSTYDTIKWERLNASFTNTNEEFSESLLKGKDLLFIFSPTKKIAANEREAVVSYLKSGGSLLFIMDEERRTPLQEVEANELLKVFGLEYTDDAPVRHNCGALSIQGEVCAEIRELPYSGGRSIKGGNVISYVNDQGKYVHSAYVKLKAGGKIVIMSDGMAGLLMGGPDGIRFSGTNPSDSKYWGKDSKLFMEEILSFFNSRQ